MDTVRSRQVPLTASRALRPADESSLKMNSVDHVPQTLASHSPAPQQAQGASRHGADMLKLDPRDTFYSRASARRAYRPPASLPRCPFAFEELLRWRDIKDGGDSQGEADTVPSWFICSRGAHDRAIAPGERASLLPLRAHIRGEGLPYRPLPGPAVCESRHSPPSVPSLCVHTHACERVHVCARTRARVRACMSACLCVLMNIVLVCFCKWCTQTFTFPSTYKNCDYTEDHQMSLIEIV